MVTPFVTSLAVSHAVALLAERVEETISDKKSDRAEFIEDVRKAAAETAEDFDGITEELLVLVLKSDDVREYAENFVSNQSKDISGDELSDVFESALAEVIDPSLDINLKLVTERFTQNLQQEVIDDPQTWETILDKYGDQISEEMSEVQREIHRQYFEENKKLREQRSDLKDKLDTRYKINIFLGTLSIGLALLSIYLSYMTTL